LLLLGKIGLVSADGDDELIEEQIDFYRTDAAAFDDWLVTLVDGHNHEPVAQNYRAGRERVTELLAQRAPLGDVLEIAAGTGRLAELYVPLSDSVLLLDASPESLAIAGRRLDSEPRITFVEADIFFDFPDAEVSPPGQVDIPAEPTEDYGFYAPQGGISVRDHFGRRWRVIHNLWHRDELTSRLDDLGWNIEFVGPGLFENIVWAEATR
jgi:SAM-dependent methyltransferase